MCPLCSEGYTSLAPLPNISSLHQNQHHFHANCHCHGNCPKEVITLVILVTDYERLAPCRVHFIRGQVAFSVNTAHIVNPPLWMVGQRKIISFRLPVIIHARQTPSAHCSALVVRLLPSLHSHLVVTKPTTADSSRSITAASSRNFHIHIVPLQLTYQVTLTDHFTYRCCLAHAIGVFCFTHCNVQMENSHRC